MKLGLLVAAWLAGLLLGFGLDVGDQPAFLLALAALLLGILLYLVGRFPWPAFMLAALLLGLWRVEVSDQPASLVAAETRTVSLKGRIVSDPEATGQRIKFVLEAQSTATAKGWQPAKGRVMVRSKPAEALVIQRDSPYFRYGDRLQMQGTLQRPEPVGDFDYPSYLEHQGITGIFWPRRVELVAPESGSPWRGWIFGQRRALSEGIARSLPAPQSALSQALLLGLRGNLPPPLVEQFRNTGTSHLLTNLDECVSWSASRSCISGVNSQAVT